MIIVRKIVLLLLKYNVHLTVVHIPGKSNTLCDKISRQQVTPQLLSFHNMNLTPHPVPSVIRPQNFKLA